MILLRENCGYTENRLFETFQDDMDFIFGILESSGANVYSLNETQNDENIIRSIISTVVRWVIKIKDFIVKFVTRITRIVSGAINAAKLKHMKEKAKNIPLGYDEKLYRIADQQFAKNKYNDIKKSISIIDGLTLMKDLNPNNFSESWEDDIKTEIESSLIKVGFSKDEAEDFSTNGRRSKADLITDYFERKIPEIKIDHNYLSSSDCVVLMERFVDAAKVLNQKTKSDLDKKAKITSDMLKNAVDVNAQKCAKIVNAQLQYNTFIVMAKTKIIELSVNTVMRIMSVYTTASNHA